MEHGAAWWAGRAWCHCGACWVWRQYGRVEHGRPGRAWKWSMARDSDHGRSWQNKVHMMGMVENGRTWCHSVVWQVWR